MDRDKQCTGVNILIDSEEEGRTAVQSTWVNILTISLTGEVAEPSTKVNM